VQRYVHFTSKTPTAPFAFKTVKPLGLQRVQSLFSARRGSSATSRPRTNNEHLENVWKSIADRRSGVQNARRALRTCRFVAEHEGSVRERWKTFRQVQVRQSDMDTYLFLTLQPLSFWHSALTFKRSKRPSHFIVQSRGVRHVHMGTGGLFVFPSAVFVYKYVTNVKQTLAFFTLYG